MTKILGIFLLVTSYSFATNGGNLIGVGPRSKAMGGTGLAHNNGHLDGIFKNPSLLTEKASNSQFNIELAGTYLGLTAKGNKGLGEVESKSKGKFIPDFAASYRLDDQITFGLGFLPYGGASFDYSNMPEATGLATEHLVARIVPSFAMKPSEHFSFGVSPVIGYGQLSLNSLATGTQTTNDKKSSMAFGYQVGVNTQWDKLMVGASFISPIKYKHEGVTNTDLFGPNAANAAFVADDDIQLQQPSELGVGVGYEAMPGWSLTFDYRNIGWSHANIYENLGWNSQDVFAFGTQVKLDKLSLRAGFNYAKAPVVDASGENGVGTASLDGHIIYQASASLLNVIGFPPIATTHFSLGGGYDVTDTFGFDLAFVYVPEATVTRSGTTTAAYSYTGKVKQYSVTAGVRIGL